MAAGRARRIVVALIVITLVGFFLPPLVNVNRYRGRLATSIGQVLGRQVTVGQVSLRLLPRPGFEMTNFEVADDPAISPEYLLRSGEVTAYLRIASLWRGRLEIARLSLTDPSLNLVRANNGIWNVEALLARASSIPAAPTAQSHAESSRQRFPYIEATGGRVNFKFGLEKKAFSFTDSDLALWLESENSWRMRLEGRPLRTDTHITDTGTVKLEATFQRNSVLRYTPLKLRLSWQDGQLGQTTKLITGSDRGWRAGWAVLLQASGTPDDLAFTADATAADFRRYDINARDFLALKTRCTGHYSASQERLWDTRCQSPVGNGMLEVNGDVQRLSNPAFNVTLKGSDVSLNEAMAFLRHAKMDLPEDLSADGTADFEFTAARALTPGSPVLWSGSGSTQDMALRSRALDRELRVGKIELTVAPENGSRNHRRPNRQPGSPVQVAGLRIAVAAFPLSLGGANPVSAQAVIQASGFNVQLAGDADVARALQVARALGIETPRLDAKGSSRLNLQVSGKWVGFEAPVTTGNVQLKNVQADVPGITEPLRIGSGNVTLTPDRITLQSTATTIAKTPAISGSVSLPRQCTAESCELAFDLHADELSLERLNQLLNPALRKHPWYNFFMPRPPEENPLATLNAQGRFVVERFILPGITANRLSGVARIASGHAEVTRMTADFLGGQHSGQWSGDFTGAAPVFHGSGSLKRAAMAQLATLMHDPWISGTADLDYQLDLSGLSPDDLWNSAKGSAGFTVRDATFRHINLDGKNGGLRSALFAGDLQLNAGVFSISGGKLQTSSGVYTVDGSAAGQQNLQFKLAGRNETLTVSGTLGQPRVAGTLTPVEAAKKR